eukprot:255266-Chlamydomonas_euryale.AAC.1
MAPTWHGHGVDMAPTWHGHGVDIAPTWHGHGVDMAPRWHGYGALVARGRSKRWLPSTTEDVRRVQPGCT